MHKDLSKLFLVTLRFREFLLGHLNAKFRHGLQDVCTLENGKDKAGRATSCLGQVHGERRLVEKALVDGNENDAVNEAVLKLETV